MAASFIPSGLIDTDILIDAARNLEQEVNFLSARRASEGITISIISAMELVVGCRNSAELIDLRRFLEEAQQMPLSAAISRTALNLVESFSLSHGLQIPDALIAATAVEHHLPLYTKNQRHFQMIQTLTVVRPY